MGNLPQATFIEGPAGSAKTGLAIAKIVRKITQEILKAEHIIILTFSIQKKNEIREKLLNLGRELNRLKEFKKIRVINLHAFATRFLNQEKDYKFGQHNRRAEDLKRLLKKKSKDKYPRLNKSLEFNEIINDFGLYMQNHKGLALQSCQLIAVDELQILNEQHLICVLGLLKHLNYPELIISGDSNQDIFHWHKDKGEARDSFMALEEALLGTYELHKTKELKYRRGTKELGLFYQGFEEVAGTDVIVKTGAKNETGAQPHIILVENKDMQILQLRKAISNAELNHPGESIMVVCRNKWILEHFLKEEQNKILTIHKSLGSEADHVIYADLSNSEDPVELRAIIRVAVTRPKKSLTIISADKEELVTKWFRPETYELTDLQDRIPMARLKKNLKHIHKNRNHSLNKITNIDSICLTVSHEDTNFAPYMPHNSKGIRKGCAIHETRYRSLKLGLETTIEDIPTYCIRISRLKNGKRSYQFRFMSTDFLRMNGYKDVDMLRAFQNEIITWFDKRIDVNTIKISRLDIASYFICTQSQKKELISRLYNDAGRNTRFKKRSTWTYENEEKSQELTSGTENLYVNMGSKAEGITVAMYDPANKPSKSASKLINAEDNRLANKRFHRDDLLKVEMRPHGMRTVKSRLGSVLLKDLMGNVAKIPGLYMELGEELEIITGDRIMGMEFVQKSQGVFEVRNGGQNGGMGLEFIGGVEGLKSEIVNNSCVEVTGEIGGVDINKLRGVGLAPCTLYYIIAILRFLISLLKKVSMRVCRILKIQLHLGKYLVIASALYRYCVIFPRGLIINSLNAYAVIQAFPVIGKGSPPPTKIF